MSPKKKLVLLFLMDCFVISLFLPIMVLAARRQWIGIGILVLFLTSLYNMTRHYVRNRLASHRKTTIREAAKGLVTLVGVALLLTAGILAKDSLNVLFSNVVFFVLVWIFGLGLCFYRFTCDLENLKSVNL
jgi:hypothetical protein